MRSLLLGLFCLPFALWVATIAALDARSPPGPQRELTAREALARALAREGLVPIGTPVERGTVRVLLVSDGAGRVLQAVVSARDHRLLGLGRPPAAPAGPSF